MTATDTTKVETHQEDLARREAEGRALRERLHLADAQALETYACRLEAENQYLREQLIRSQRLAMLGTMTSMTVHEVRNFLTPVVSYAEMALKDPALMPKAIAKAASAGGRAADVAEAMLRIARGELHEPVEFDVSQLICETRTILAMLRAPERDGIEIASCTPDGLMMFTDKVALQQVLLNLLLNARAAVLARGVPRRIEIAAERQDRSVAIRVADNGVGIRREHLERIFEPFFTTRQRGDVDGPGGHGLGLAVCKLIADYLRGEIWGDGEPGRGATFTVRVPG